MSKLAHSNDETMRKIEGDRRREPIYNDEPENEDAQSDPVPASISEAESQS